MENNRITINGVEYDLVPVKPLNKNAEEKPKTGYERATKDTNYWVVSSYSGAFEDKEKKLAIDAIYYNAGNYYTDKQLAENNGRADSILRRMRQWQALNDEPVDIYNAPHSKYEIVFVADDKTLQICRTNAIISNYTIYFSSEEKAQEALEVFKDELIWLHTKYRRRLDEPERE